MKFRHPYWAAACLVLLLVPSALATRHNVSASALANPHITLSFEIGERSALPSPSVDIPPFVLPDPTPVPTPVPAPQAPMLRWPVRGPITTYYSAGHPAIDIEARAGTSVVAANSGTVVYSGWKSGGGGIVVFVDRGNGLVTGYSHLSATLVSVGQHVAVGQKIAEVGCTGMCTGPHLHFTVWVKGVTYNPLRFL